MPRAVCVSHVPHEGPGLLRDALEARGLPLDLVEAHRGEPLPSGLGGRDLLLVMGGPMGVADVGSAAAPWLAPLVGILRERLDRAAPVLGICLGAQLLAHAAGARVAPMTDARGARLREVGWGEVRLHRGADPLLDGLPARIEVLHWHGDACALPAGAALLASTDACPVQMFRLGRAIGIQFHPEIDGPTSAAWADEDAAFVAAAAGPEGIARIRAEAPAAGRRSEPLRRLLLERSLDAILGTGLA